VTRWPQDERSGTGNDCCSGDECCSGDDYCSRNDCCSGDDYGCGCTGVGRAREDGQGERGPVWTAGQVRYHVDRCFFINVKRD
jgi:hypothetical protein